jgi:hypothetical protein
LGKIVPGHNEARSLDHLATGWIALPQIEAPALAGAKEPIEFAPVDLEVTVMEANDLGDVIAKGAAKAEENKGDLAEKLLKAIGVSDTEE